MVIMNDLSEVLKHANLAHFDNELTSFVIVMIAKGDPEVHMAISSDDVYAMNAALDMFKVEMLKIMNARAEERKPRE
jgi:hypothetical protein